MDYTSEIAELLSRHGFHRFMMSRTQVGHLKLVGHLDGRPIDIVLDTGASKTVIDLSYCRSEGVAVSDTGQPGAPRAGAGDIAVSVHTLGDVRLTLEGLPVRCDGIFAIDMTNLNQKLIMKGAGAPTLKKCALWPPPTKSQPTRSPPRTPLSTRATSGGKMSGAPGPFTKVR